MINFIKLVRVSSIGFIFAVFAIIVLGEAAFSQNDNAKTPICNDWAEIQFQTEYTISNNVWNKGNIADYQQCIWEVKLNNMMNWGWTWIWPKDGGNVKSYPEIIYGWKPWNSGSTTSHLPIQLDHINQITVDYDTILSATGAYNIAFDLWITSESAPNQNNITHEIMIWVETQGLTPAGNLIETVTLGGEKYGLYKGNVSHAKWTYIAFVKAIPQRKGTINVHELLKYLKDKNFISPNGYLACIEFGNEVIEGKGELTIQNYSVQVN